MDNQPDPMTWYNEIPIVSRVYLTLAFITTAACALDLVSPFSLYFNYKLIFVGGQIWRLFTNFFFFGLFGLDFIFHMYFLVNYCRLLEEGEFRGRTADFVYMIMFGGITMTAVAPFVNVHFLGSALTFMMVYVWSQRNQHMRMGFLGLVPFRAPYLPWVLFSLSVMLGADPTIDLIGIACGHVYFWLKFIFPRVADIRGWWIRDPMGTPWILRQLLGGQEHGVQFADELTMNDNGINEGDLQNEADFRAPDDAANQTPSDAAEPGPNQQPAEHVDPSVPDAGVESKTALPGETVAAAAE